MAYPSIPSGALSTSGVSPTIIMSSVWGRLLTSSTALSCFPAFMYVILSPSSLFLRRQVGSSSPLPVLSFLFVVVLTGPPRVFVSPPLVATWVLVGSPHTSAALQLAPILTAPSSSGTCLEAAPPPWSNFASPLDPGGGNIPQVTSSSEGAAFWGLLIF